MARMDEGDMAMEDAARGDDRLLKAVEVQRELGVSRATEYRMMTDGTLPSYRFGADMGGGRWCACRGRNSALGWMFIRRVPKRGVIHRYVLIFGVETNSAQWHNAKAKLLKAGFVLRQDGDAEGCLTFSPLDERQSKLAIEVLGCRRKPTRSPVQVAALVLSGEKTRFLDRQAISGGQNV